MVNVPIAVAVFVVIAFSACGIASVIISVSAYEGGRASREAGRACGIASLVGFCFFVLGVIAGGGTLSWMPPMLQLGVFMGALTAVMLGSIGIGFSFLPVQVRGRTRIEVPYGYRKRQ